LSFLVPAVALAAQLAVAQWLETKIPLVDSFSGAIRPQCIVYNATNNKVYVGGWRGRYLVVIDAANRQRVARVFVDWNASALCWNSTDNKVYCCAGGDHETKLVIIDAVSDTVLAVVPLALPHLLCYNSVENKVYCTFGVWSDSVAVISGRTNQIVARFPLATGPLALVCNPVSNAVYCAGINGTIIVIDGQGDSVVATIPTHGGELLTLCVDSISNKLYCSNGDVARNLLVIDAASNTVTDSLTVSEMPSAMCYVPAVNRLYAIGEFRGSVSVVDCATDSVIATIPVGWWPRALCSDATGQSVFCLNWESETVTEIDCASNRTVSTVDVGRDPAAFCYASRERDLYCANHGGDDVSVVSGAPDGPRTVSRVVVGAQPLSRWALCYSTASHKLYSANGPDGTVSVIDGATNRSVATVEVGGWADKLCYASAVERMYCSNQEDCRVTVIDCRTDRVVRSVGLAGTPAGLCYASRENKMYCALSMPGSGEGCVSVIDCRTDSVTATLHVGAVSFCYSTASNKLYIGNQEEHVVLDCATDSVIARLPIPSNIAAPGYNPVDNKYYVVSYFERSPHICVVDCAADTLVATIPTSGFYNEICHARTVNKVYCAEWYYGKIVVLDGKTDSVLKIIRVPGDEGFSVCYNPVDEIVYHLSTPLGRLSIIDCMLDSVTGTLELGCVPYGLCMNPAQNRLYLPTPRESYVAVVRGVGAGATPEVPTAASARVRSQTVVGRQAPLIARWQSLLYDATGRLVKRLEPGLDCAGGLPPGVYYLQSQRTETPRKIVVLR
jgi:YVTN family beta-propeller protein